MTISCRGALNGLTGDLVEEHIREHIVEAENKKLATESGEEQPISSGSKVQKKLLCLLDFGCWSKEFDT